MREEKRIGTSSGFGLALYPTANAPIDSSLLVASKPLRSTLKPGPRKRSRVGRHYQAEIPSLLSSEAQAAALGDQSRVGELVPDPVAVEPRLDTRGLAHILDE